MSSNRSRGHAPGGPSRPAGSPLRGFRILTQPIALSSILVAATLLFSMLEMFVVSPSRTVLEAILVSIGPLIASMSVLLMRTTPWVVLATAIAAYATNVLTAGSSPVSYILLAIGCASVAAWGPGVRFAVPAVAAGTLMVEMFNPAYGIRSEASEFALVLYSVVLPVLVGALAVAVGLAARRQDQILVQLRSQHDRLADLQRRETDAAVAIERTRIARELHDVVAHHVSALLIQAEAGQRTSRRSSPEQAERWQSVAEVARETLLSMRRAVGLLRTEDDQVSAGDPQPRLSDLDRLVADVRRSGLDVRLRVGDGLGSTSADIQLCAYRIVQEGLTNVLRHASASLADVVVTSDGRELTIDLSDDGRVDDGFRAGNGLLGMRERVAAVGGRLEIAAKPGSGLRIHATLPAPVRLPAAPPVPAS